MCNTLHNMHNALLGDLTHLVSLQAGSFVVVNNGPNICGQQPCVDRDFSLVHAGCPSPVLQIPSS